MTDPITYIAEHGLVSKLHPRHVVEPADQTDFPHLDSEDACICHCARCLTADGICSCLDCCALDNHTHHRTAADRQETPDVV